MKKDVVRHVLLADDDEDDRDFFVRAMSEADATVRVTMVRNGEELMNELIMGNAAPDLLFLDLNMPRKNGKECLSEMESNPKLNSIPVVIYSTSINKEELQQEWTKRVFCFVRKPDSYTALVDIVRKVLNLDARESLTLKEKVVFNVK